MINPIDTKLLTPKDAFSFACTQCGECCFDQLVLLDPFDLFYLSRLGELPASTTAALFDARYVELLQLDGQWRCALVMPKFQKGTKCRFLTPKLTDKGNILGWFCELHQKGAKPLVCISSPIAQDIEGNFYLVPPVDSCPGMNQGEPEQLQGYTARLQINARLEDSLWFHQVSHATTQEEAQKLYDFDQGETITTMAALRDYLRRLLGAA